MPIIVSVAPADLLSRPTSPVADGRTPAPPDAVNLLLLLPLIVLGALALSWKENRPIGPGALLTGAGQVTGLASAVFALCTVALMARVPVVTHRLGADRALVWHRVAATLTVVLLLVHVPAVTLGYAAADRTAIVTELGAFLTSFPDMITAAVATALLLLISVSSIRAVRRRLPYESWLFGHWYAYPAVALSFGHEISTGASFVDASAPTLAWTWLHLFVGGLVVWYRLLVPAWRMATHRLTVVAVRPAGGSAVHLSLTGRHLDDYEPRAGQHVRIRFLNRGGWWQSHPFSFSAAPRPDRWRITVASTGDYGPVLATLPPGTRALVSGVYGSMTTRSRHGDSVALIAGGSGVLPLRALLEALPARVDVRVLYRASSADDLIAADELDELAARRSTHVDYLLGPRHPDPRADLVSPRSLHALVPDLAARDVYVCGHAGFVEAVEHSLHRIGVPRSHIHTERFDP